MDAREALLVLDHASGCAARACPMQQCEHMRTSLLHLKECPAKVRGGCSDCRRVMRLVGWHAQRCTRTECKVPHCGQFKHAFAMLHDETPDRPQHLITWTPREASHAPRQKTYAEKRCVPGA